MFIFRKLAKNILKFNLVGLVRLRKLLLVLNQPSGCQGSWNMGIQSNFFSVAQFTTKV